MQICKQVSVTYQNTTAALHLQVSLSQTCMTVKYIMKQTFFMRGVNIHHHAMKKGEQNRFPHEGHFDSLKYPSQA